MRSELNNNFSGRTVSDKSLIIGTKYYKVGNFQVKDMRNAQGNVIKYIICELERM